MQSQFKVVPGRGRCGRCEHEHAVAGRCICGCGQFTLHQQTWQHLQERLTREREAYPQGTLLGPRTVDAIVTVVDELEAQLMRQFQWDQLSPILFVINALRVNGQHSLAAVPLLIPRFFWSQLPDDRDLVLALAAKAASEARWFANFRRACGLDPRLPILAWGLAAEGASRGTFDKASGLEVDRGRGEEFRIVWAADLDERQYAVQRPRRADQSRASSLMTAQELRTDVLDAGVLPRMPLALASLARLTAQEAALSAVFAQFEAGPAPRSGDNPDG